MRSLDTIEEHKHPFLHSSDLLLETQNHTKNHEQTNEFLSQSGSINSIKSRIDQTGQLESATSDLMLTDQQLDFLVLDTWTT